MSDATSLPARPSLEQLQKQAKELLKQFRAGESVALERFRLAGPKPKRATLADAQFVLAREFGLESWAKLKREVELRRPSGLRQYDRLALDLAAAYTSGDPRAVREVNGNYGTAFTWDHEPSEMQRRLAGWFASETRTPDLALADAQSLVAHSYGFESWAEVVKSVTRTAAEARSSAPVFLNPAPPFYQIDWKNDRLSVRGPLSGQDWDTILGVMKEHRIAKLTTAAMTDAAMKHLALLDHVTHLCLGNSKDSPTSEPGIWPGCRNCGIWSWAARPARSPAAALRLSGN